MVVPSSKSTGCGGKLANKGGAAATMMVRSNGDGDSDGDQRTERRDGTGVPCGTAARDRKRCRLLRDHVPRAVPIRP